MSTGTLFDRFLHDKGVSARQFNSYGSRRGNDAVMIRGTFASPHIKNRLSGFVPYQTLHVPSGEMMSVFEAVKEYQKSGTLLLILAGWNYGRGASRDWAAKGPALMGVKGVLARSYEKIHRSNLVGMGILPLQFLEGEDAQSLGLSGDEVFRIDLPALKKTQETLDVVAGKTCFRVETRLDTELELEYYRHGGILNFMIRQLLRK